MSVMLIVTMPDSNECIITDMSQEQWDVIGLMLFKPLYDGDSPVQVFIFASWINQAIAGLQLAKQIYFNNHQYADALNVQQLIDFKDQHDCLENGLYVSVQTDNANPSSDFLTATVKTSYLNQEVEMPVDCNKLKRFFKQTITEGEYVIYIGSAIANNDTLVISLHRTSNDAWLEACLNDETIIPLDDYHITV